MSPESQRIAIAKAHLGFEHFDWLLWCANESCLPWEGRRLHGAKRSDNNWNQVPDYLNDLNAMHEAEKILTYDQFDEYYVQLSMKMVRPFHATAAQRAEAFLRTIGKWKEARK